MLILTKNYFIKANNPSKIINISSKIQETLDKANIKYSLSFKKEKEEYILNIKVKDNEQETKDI